jgi:hypothetical protein
MNKLKKKIHKRAKEKESQIKTIRTELEKIKYVKLELKE